MISCVYEHDQALDEVAHEFAASYHPRPLPKEDPAISKRFLERVLQKFDEPVRQELERLAERFAEARSRGEEPDPRDIEWLTKLLGESRERKGNP